MIFLSLIVQLSSRDIERDANIKTRKERRKKDTREFKKRKKKKRETL